MTSMVLKEKNEGQLTKSSKMADLQPMFQKGMITIKVKEGIRELRKQNRDVFLNIPSLDLKVNKYEVDLLDKRFRYNPEKLKKGMPDLSRIYRITFPEKYSVTKVAEEFAKDQNIEYAEPIPVNYLLEVPNDPMYGDLHHLPQIKADSAWDIHKGENGTEEVVIAIVDSGVEWDHEDLVDNIWQNMGEDYDGDGKTIEFVGGKWIFDLGDENGVDDDNNGFVDDFIGWNFFSSGNDPSPIPGLYKWEHGTLMGGYASATTNNNIGVASISWNLKILPVQAGWDCKISQAYNAIIYAAENGADIISNSWGGYEFNSLANQEVIEYVIGLGSIIVAATANDNQSKNIYPASYPGVIAVSALNHIDQKASYSNFGPHVTVSAPGGDGGFELLTTDVNNSYSCTSGTSCATPIVASLLGLVKSYHPEWSADQVITQVLGTADPIDSYNPGFENLLGSGRINAYKALTDTGVTLDQEISIDLHSLSFQDSDGNNMLELGDTASLTLKLRNYNYGVGSDNATFTLTTEEPTILLLNDTCSGAIPADDFFMLDNVFQFIIVDAESTCFANFQLITTADVEITWGATIDLKVLIAPQGFLVYQGEGTSYAYSGDYINGFLVEQGHQVFYTTHFPSSLKGFDAAFLSYGNYNIDLRSGTPITMEMTQAMKEYLINSGRIYIDCGTFFGIQAYYAYPNLQELKELFSIAETDFQQIENTINMLGGLPGSICEGIEFTNSTQFPYWHIEFMTPNDNGIASFEEQDYGTVAIEGEGEYGQKTFYLSYALAHLDDNSQGTRDELMTQIVNFFMQGVGDNEIISEKQIQEITIFPCPFNENTNIHFTLNEDSYIKLEIFDLTGNQVAILCDKNLQSGYYIFQFNGEYISHGIYFCRLQVGDQVVAKKIIKQ